MAGALSRDVWGIGHRGLEAGHPESGRGAGQWWETRERVRAEGTTRAKPQRPGTEALSEQQETPWGQGKNQARGPVRWASALARSPWSQAARHIDRVGVQIAAVGKPGSSGPAAARSRARGGGGGRALGQGLWLAQCGRAGVEASRPKDG